MNQIALWGQWLNSDKHQVPLRFDTLPLTGMEQTQLKGGVHLIADEHVVRVTWECRACANRAMRVTNVCIKPVLKDCPANVHQLWSGMEDAFEYMCGDAMQGQSKRWK